MQRIQTSIPGVLELRSTVFRDARGFFVETYHQTQFSELGISETFVQDNHSCSVQGTLRGLHYQLRRPQAKVCRVIEGEALDIAVDIRQDSPTFGKSVSVILSAKSHNQLYIPTGFAHGFLALTERVQFLYKCSDFYDPKDERGILWNDPDLAIDWGVEAPLISEKDAKCPTLAAVPKEFLPKYSAK